MDKEKTKKKIVLPDTDEELLLECDITTFRSSGKGGQYVNKTESAVRLVHRSTGIVVVSRKERSQYLNKKECLKNLRKRINALNVEEIPRIATVIPLSVKKIRKESKNSISRKKELRKKPLLSD